MEREWNNLQRARPGPAEPLTWSALWAGVTLAEWTAAAPRLSLPHPAWDQLLVILHCRAGHLVWQTGEGTELALGPGDYAVHAMCPGAEMVLTLPDGSGQGLALFLDPAALSETALDLLAGTGLTGARLREKFCRDRDARSFAGNEETGRLFRGFYDQPSHLKGAYQKLKTAELLLYLWRMEDPPGRDLSRYSADQIATIRAMHDSLTDHLDQRVTIEALARQYLMNQTTLKRVFKAVYGNSLAAHMKEHRMEQAAKYLLETERSIAEIAQAVGYDSQSRFSKAFQETFSLLPTEFRRSHRER